MSGYTKDGRPVLGNIFVQCESRGVQLEFMIDSILSQGAFIDWILFYEDSLKAKWLTSTTIKKIQYSLQETMGIEYTNQVIYRLKIYISQREQSIK